MDKRIARLLGEVKAALEEEDSDIDGAIISDDFKDMNLLQRLETIGLALAKARILEPVEPLAYTEEELKSKDEGSFLQQGVAIALFVKYGEDV